MSRPDVPRYFRIAARFWSDEKSAGWSDETKLAALYVLTCRHRHLEGIFVLPICYMAADLRWSVKRVRRALVNLENAGFLKVDAGSNLILIRNALRYQFPENPNMIEGCLRRILELPKTGLLQEFQGLVREHCYRKGVSSVAQSFHQLLEERLTQRFEQPFSNHNLESDTSKLNQKQKLRKEPLHLGVGDRMGRSDSQRTRERLEIDEAVRRGE